MGSRVPVQHYNLRSANSFIGSSLHDLNTVDARPDIDAISDVDRGTVTEDSLDNDDEPSSVDCLHDSYRNSLSLQGVGVEDRSSLENNGASRSPYDFLTLDDVLPIETARARFLEIIVDNFISQHVIAVVDSSEADYDDQSGQDKLNKRKPREEHYEGDPGFVLPLMYVANLYETLVNGVNIRLSSLDGIREKTIGVALEAAGGLYRRLARKFPKKGLYTFKRRELATSVETRTRFPELVIQEEKRVRFVVVNGLNIVEKPTSMTVDDAEWFKRLTGRHEVAVTARDYKFYSPRHKYRRIPSQSVPIVPQLGALSGTDNSTALSNPSGFLTANEQQNQQQHSPKHQMQPLPHQPQFHSLQQAHRQAIHQSHATHFPNTHQCTHSTHLPEINHHQSPTMSQHMACLQPLPGGHVGGRLHVMPTSLPKYCDECGAPYLRDTSKFCSECGVKRLGT